MMFSLKTIATAIVVCLLLCLVTTQSADVLVSKQEAIKAAEQFVRENGYTDAPASAIKEELDYESFEYAQNRDALLKFRLNTLIAKAMGVKRGVLGGKLGWSVAFDYVGKRRDTCRVVTMNDDESGIRIQHQDGIRSYFAGFEVE